MLIMALAACVDRIFIGDENPSSFPVVIEGKITDQPGPYRISIFTGFDLEDQFDREPVRARRVIIRDDKGNLEVLNEIEKGIYETSASGIRGTVGNVYTTEIEFSDGGIYESSPDTLLAPGSMDSLYYDFNNTGVNSPLGYLDYGFDIFFNSSAGNNSDYFFMWTFTATFKAITFPQNRIRLGCYEFEGYCNWVPPCSGYRNTSRSNVPQFAIIESVEPCTCCTCWYDLVNDIPLLAESSAQQQGNFLGMKAYRLLLDEWVFATKVYIEVKQSRLTRQAYDFWNAIKDQKLAIYNLFQPVTGKIPTVFRHVGGPERLVAGLFYASSTVQKSFYLTRDDVPNPDLIPKISATNMIFSDDCRRLFPRATTTKPVYWED